MKRFLIIAALCLGFVAPANAQIVTKYSGIQPLEHPSSYAEKYFGEELTTLSKGTVKVDSTPFEIRAELGPVQFRRMRVMGGTK